MGYKAGRCNKTSTPEGICVVIPSLEGWPTKAKEATSPHEVRLTPLDTNRLFQCLEKKDIDTKTKWYHGKTPIAVLWKIILIPEYSPDLKKRVITYAHLCTCLL